MGGRVEIFGAKQTVQRITVRGENAHVFFHKKKEILRRLMFLSSCAARPRTTWRPMDEPPKVALLIETSNSYSRELLHGVRAWVREHGPWSIRLTEQGRGAAVPK